MSEDCSIYNCEIGEEKFKTSDKQVYTARHEWDLVFSWNNIELCKVTRRFNLETTFNMKYEADKYKSAFGSISPCNPTSTGSLGGAMSERIEGQCSLIMYADLEHDVYLIRKQAERHASSVTEQNPFHYFNLYATQDSIAYFMDLQKAVDVEFALYIGGVKKYSFIKPTVTSTHSAQPVVWPLPGSKSMFFLAAPGYEWMDITGFYSYNDPSDLGYSPCYTGFMTGDGVGMLTGYSRAEKDGGKDFFYPQWMRDSVFVGQGYFHTVMQQEAAKRFLNVLGGPISEICAAPFTEAFNIGMWISEAIIGNYIKYADHDFYSFFLPEVEQVINNLGNAEIKQLFDAAVAAAKDDDGLSLNLPTPEIYYPIGIA